MDGRDGGEHGLRAVFGEETVQVRLGPPGRRHLREDVSLALFRSAYVGEHHVEVLADGTVFGEQAKGRDAQSFLPGIGGAGQVAAGGRAADVGPVGEVDRERDESAVEEHRPDRLHVGQVIAADLGQVEEPHVARREPRLRHALEKLPHREAHDSHVYGNVPPLGDEVAVRVGQRRGEIAGLAQERRAGRAHDHQRHLLRGSAEGVTDDLQGHGIDAAGHRETPVAICRWPASSARSVAPGGTTTVDHASSTTAGPARVRPALTAARG